MTTPKFTPGPWHYGITSECIINARGEEIADLSGSFITEKEDNARLIVSAPALYAALEDTANDCCDIRIALQSPVMTDSEKLAMIQKLVDKSRDARQSSLALARGEKGESK